MKNDENRGKNWKIVNWKGWSSLIGENKDPSSSLRRHLAQDPGLSCIQVLFHDFLEAKPSVFL